MSGILAGMGRSVSPARARAGHDQPSPDSPRYIGRWLGRIYRAGHLHIAHALRDGRLSYGQYPFLLFINGHPGCSQDEIARDLFFDKGVTARAVARLIEAGLVTCTTCPCDRRRHQLTVTADGQQVLTRLRAVLSDWQEILFTGLSDEERVTLQTLLERVAANCHRRDDWRPRPTIGRRGSVREPNPHPSEEPACERCST